MKRSISVFLLAILLLSCGAALADINIDLFYSDTADIHAQCDVRYSTDGGRTYLPLSFGMNTIPGNPTEIAIKLTSDMSGKTNIAYAYHALAPEMDVNWVYSGHESLSNGILVYFVGSPGKSLSNAAYEVSIVNYPASESFTRDTVDWAGFGDMVLTVAGSKYPYSIAINDTLNLPTSPKNAPYVIITAATLASLTAGKHSVRAYFREDNKLTCAEASITIPKEVSGRPAVQTAEDLQSDPTAYWTATVGGVKNWCNARSGPGTEHGIVGTAKAGSPLEIRIRDTKWSFVTFVDIKTGKETSGWISNRFIKE